MVVISGGTEHYQRLESFQRFTWGRDTDNNFKTIWLRGSEGKDFHFDQDLSILNVPVEETFANILEKTQLGIRWVMNQWNPDFIIRTNNSSYWSREETEKVLDRLPPGGLYGGVIGQMRHRQRMNDRLIDFISGAGIWFSRDVATLLSEAESASLRYLVDDVAIGLIAQDQFPDMIEISRCDVTDYEPVFRSAHTRVKHWSRPDVTERRLMMVDDIYRSKSVVEMEKRLRMFYEIETPTAHRDKRGFKGAKTNPLKLRSSWERSYSSFVS